MSETREVPVFEEAELRVVRGAKTGAPGKVVFLDWWSAGGLFIDRENATVVAHRFGEQESHELHNVEFDLFTGFAAALNRIHGVDRSRRYWRIVAGAWHQEFFFVIADRVTRLLASERFARRLRYLYGSTESPPLPVADGSLFPITTCHPVRESFLVGELIESLHARGLATHIMIAHSEGMLRLPADDGVASQEIPIRERILRATDDLAAWLARRSPFELSDTYLSLSQESELRLRLGNLSFLRLGRRPDSVGTTDVDAVLRSSLEKSLAGDHSSPIVGAYRNLLPRHVPSSYLERFPELDADSRRLADSHVPRVYFTANRFGMSDHERVHIAEKVERGAKYIVAQHGNNYGVTYRPMVLPEEETADQFLRWGVPPSGQDKSIGVITSRARVPMRPPRGGKMHRRVLIFGSQPPTRTFRYYDWDQYFESESQTIELVRHLGAMGFEVLYRAYPGTYFGGGVSDEFAQWLRDAPFTLARGSVKKALRGADLSVFMYDSTGFLELVSKDVPCLQVQSGPMDHVSSGHREIYEHMIEVALLNGDVGSVIESVHGKTVSEWWEEPARRRVREEVKTRLAMHAPHLVRDLASTLRAHAGDEKNGQP